MFEAVWFATQIFLLVCLVKNVHVLTKVVATVYQKSSGNVMQF
ncbi:replication protein [Lacticaseibacillus paracasei]|nr:replication protein [Lacticaseibacillus paracasei]